MPLLCLFSITDGLHKTESKGKDYTSINVRKVLRNEKKKTQPSNLTCHEMSFTQTCKAGIYIIGIAHFWNKTLIPLKQTTKLILISSSSPCFHIMISEKNYDRNS